MKHRRFHPLPTDRLTRLEGWAMMAGSMGYVYRPDTLDGVRDVLRLARESGRPLVPRGSGFSYGDTALNAENIVLDMTAMNRVLAWDRDSGIIRGEPGVTIGQLWRHTLPDGWWPAVVPGTMFPTLGGCASTNVHGKNEWRVGSLGDQILSAELLLPSGETIACGPDENAEIFRAAIGGLGMLGVFLSLTVRTERVASGLVRVEEHAAHTLEEMFGLFEANLDRAEHLLGVFLSLTVRTERVASGLVRVEEHAAHALEEMFGLFEANLDRAEHLLGWIDGFASGASLGRGLVHLAGVATDDPDPARTLQPGFQDLPDRIAGVLPRSMLWRGMKLTANAPGMRALNEARYRMGALRSGRVMRLPHAQFHFILDYVPNWKWAFRPIGIVQYQVFVPEAQARSAYAALLEESQRAGLVPYLAVFKRHREDPFLLSYSVDGYSLALDYHATPRNERRLFEMLSRFTHQIVLPAGGRFYPAKDNAVDRDSLRRSLTPEAMDAYLALKQRLDPDGIFQSDLFRRVFAG